MGLKVMAIQDCYLKCFRTRGDVFEIPGERAFSKAWMKPVDWIPGGVPIGARASKEESVAVACSVPVQGAHEPAMPPSPGPEQKKRGRPRKSV